MLDHNDHSFVEYLNNTYRYSTTDGEFHPLYIHMLNITDFYFINLLYFHLEDRFKICVHYFKIELAFRCYN